MKNIFIATTFAVIILCNAATAQTNTFPSTGATGIGTTAPNASSLLEISSTAKGFLAPRMTKVQRDAIASPATGLLIYQTSSGPGFYYYSGSTWKAVTPATGGANTALSNLATTAIDSSLLPAVTNSINLGSSALRWKDLNLYNLKFSDGTIQSTAARNYTAGTGIGITGTTISNTAPDKTVVLTAGSGISVTGTYPNFTITNTIPKGWSLTGNAGTNPATNFIGTTDAQPLVFKVNNVRAGYLDYTNGNAAFGYQSLVANSSGANNAAFGYSSLKTNTTGIRNTAVGAYSLSVNTTGSSNTAAGTQSLEKNTTGYDNTASGDFSLEANTTGNSNTAMGKWSLTANKTGSNNVAIGESALYYNTASYNTAVGSGSSLFNTTGSYNTALGFQSLYVNTTGNENTAVGLQSLYNNTTGSNNTANGYNAMYNNTTGEENTAYGGFTLLYNKTGHGNTASGMQALRGNTTGTYNVGNGNSALISNTTGSYNVAIGNAALYSSQQNSNAVAIGNDALYTYNNGTSNDNLVAVGDEALLSNTTGANNTAVGASALQKNTAAYGNTAVGALSLNNNGNGATQSYDAVSNTAIGASSLYYNTIGYNNTAGGSKALYGNTSGYNNAAFGLQALISNTDGIGNTAVGVAADVSDGSLQNATAIGYFANVNASNKVRIGNPSVTVVESNAGSWTVSDGRFKNNIKENVKGLEFIKLLKPVTYNFDTRKFTEFLLQHYPDSLKKKRLAEMDDNTTAKASGIVQSGFVAQDVADAVKKSGYNFNGVHAPENAADNWSLSYEKLVVPLVKAVQELSAQNDALKNENSSLRKDFNDLKALVVSIQQKQESCSPCSAGTAQSVQSSSILLTDGSSLQQNIPNPFSSTTSISYNLPQKFANALIIITDKSGKTLKQITISGSGKGSLNVDATMLAAGAYNYSLIVDGKLIATKQMVLAK